MNALQNFGRRATQLGLLLASTALMAAPVSVKDDLGNTVSMPAPATRIVTLSPSVVEVAYAAGAGEQIVGAQQRLSKAQEAVRQAESVLQEARDAFFRAKGRQDALEKRRDLWKREQRGLFERQEEATNEDLMQARYMAARQQ